MRRNGRKGKKRMEWKCRSGNHVNRHRSTKEQEVLNNLGNEVRDSRTMAYKVIDLSEFMRTTGESDTMRHNRCN